jgi:hypothetical protein
LASSRLFVAGWNRGNDIDETGRGLQGILGCQPGLGKSRTGESEIGFEFGSLVRTTWLMHYERQQTLRDEILFLLSKIAYSATKMTETSFVFLNR